MTLRRTLLFVCPIMPQRSGNGLAMRAGLMLEGLARRVDVYLFVVRVGGDSTDVPDFVRKLTVKVSVPALCDIIDPLADLISRIGDPAERRRQGIAYSRPWTARFSGMAAAQHSAALVEGIQVDMLYVMRLYMAPLASHILRIMKPSPLVALLDLDDDDARVHERMAELHELRGDSEGAKADRLEAAKYAACAADVLARFNAVLMASQDDLQRLAVAHPTVRFEAVANGYRNEPPCPSTARRHRTGIEPVRLLFVANLGYFPNEDAATQLIDSVVPELRGHGADIYLDIVGPGDSADRLRKAASARVIDRIAIHGKVASVSDWYAQADIAVMPLRAGGGTRIKILEAFAYGVPVVSSYIGAEGLDAEHAKHLLCADNTADFASACLRLAAEPAPAASLVAAAKELLYLNYTPDRVYARLDTIIDSLPFEG